jgi:hypothetical protein
MNLVPLTWYKWLWQKFRLSRKVGRMNYIERGLYRDLLDEQWEKGSVSGEAEDMADICGCPVDVMANAWQVIGKCFDCIEGRFVNATLEEQRTEKDAERIKRSKSGHLGGVAKAERNQPEASKCLAPVKQILAPSQDKIRGEEKREEKERKEKNGFSAPSVADVKTYCEERKNSVDPEKFCSFYESNGWRVGKNPMKNWRAAVRTWEGNGRGFGKVEKAPDAPDDEMTRLWKEKDARNAAKQKEEKKK